MVDKNDWRIRNQQDYLFGKKLTLKKFSSTKTDHEHCEFCWQKIMDDDSSDVIREAYTTDDNYYWICPECFKDFKEMFSLSE
jgi:hypothetical protein